MNSIFSWIEEKYGTIWEWKDKEVGGNHFFKWVFVGIILFLDWFVNDPLGWKLKLSLREKKIAIEVSNLIEFCLLARV